MTAASRSSESRSTTKRTRASRRRRGCSSWNLPHREDWASHPLLTDRGRQVHLDALTPANGGQSNGTRHHGVARPARANTPCRRRPHKPTHDERLLPGDSSSYGFVPDFSVHARARRRNEKPSSGGESWPPHGPGLAVFHFAYPTQDGLKPDLIRGKHALYQLLPLFRGNSMRVRVRVRVRVRACAHARVEVRRTGTTVQTASLPFYFLEKSGK